MLHSHFFALIHCLHHGPVDPRFQFAVPSRRTIKAVKLPAVAVEDKCRRGFYREPPGKGRFSVHINPDDFEPAGPSCRKLVDEWFNSAAVAAPFCPELGQYDLRPIINLGIIAQGCHIQGSMGEFERRPAMTADRVAYELFFGNSVQSSA